jgi:hypothetical protein
LPSLAGAFARRFAFPNLFVFAPFPAHNRRMAKKSAAKSGSAGLAMRKIVAQRRHHTALKI